MAQFLHELALYDNQDWMHLITVLVIVLIGLGLLIMLVLSGLRKLRLSLGKDGVKLNDNANDKLDCIIEKLTKLEKDVVALQIMNEHITPCERIKLYDYYKHSLHGNSFIDEYVKVIKEEIDTSRFL